MKLKLIILARLTILICLALGYKINQSLESQSIELDNAQVQIEGLRTAMDSSTNHYGIFSELPEIGGSAKNLNDNFVLMLRELNIAAIENGLSVVGISAARANPDSPITEAAAPIEFGGGALVSVGLDFSFVYTDYAGLKLFLSELYKKNIQVKSLTISGKQGSLRGAYFATK